MVIEDFDLHFLTKIDVIIEFLLTLLGNGLCLVIVNYEQVGMNVMKRSILNKLISSTCLACIGGMFPSALSLLLRAVFGGLGENLASTIVFVQIFFFIFFTINVIFIFGYKDLSILSFNFVNHLDEEFWFIYSQLLNAFLAFSLTALEHYLADQTRPLAKAVAGVPIGDVTYGRIMFGLLACGALFMFLSHLVISLYKVFQDQSQVEDEPNSGKWKSVIHDPNVLTDLQLLSALTLFVCTAGLPKIITGGAAPDTADQVLLLWLPLRLGMGLIFPLMFLCFNPKIKVHFKKVFWNWAPDSIQDYNPYLHQMI